MRRMPPRLGPALIPSEIGFMVVGGHSIHTGPLHKSSESVGESSKYQVLCSRRPWWCETAFVWSPILGCLFLYNPIMMEGLVWFQVIRHAY